MSEAGYAAVLIRDMETASRRVKQERLLRSTHRKEARMIPNKVLVVDDEKHLRMLYQDELQGDGYTVATSDGTEPILDVILREDPSVVVLDIKLGDHISGLNLLQEIRSSALDRPVILSTAYDAFQHDLKSIAATAYVVKSVDLTELKAQIAAAMRG